MLSISLKLAMEDSSVSPLLRLHLDRYVHVSYHRPILTLEQEDVARYLSDIVPPVLACFTDQDARVRYYACEAMYNIAKVAKGEILLFFNEIFDALCKVGTLRAARALLIESQAGSRLGTICQEWRRATRPSCQRHRIGISCVLRFSTRRQRKDRW